VGKHVWVRALGSLVIAGGLSGVWVAPVAASSTIPSGQRTLGQSVLEPVYNDENAGQIGYIKEPENAPQPIPANPVAWAPFYLVVYPVTSTVARTTTFLCQHTPGPDNCPTHGNNIATLAVLQEPSVYGAGVAGHDHLMDFPGGPDFNIAWEPTVVLFTPTGVADGTANEHILTDSQIQAAVANQDVKVVKLPQRTFICSSVPERLYEMATPLIP
jgi:hypothetical protein